MRSSESAVNNGLNALPQTPSEPRPTDRYEALFRVSQTLSTHRDPQELFRVLARELRSVLQFDYIIVKLYDENARAMRLYLIEGLNPSPDCPAFQFDLEETMAGWVYRQQQPMVIPFLERDTRFPKLVEFLRQKGIRSICDLPLTTAHRRLGVLSVGSAYPHAYSEEEVCFLSLVADQVALAIDDALNFQASQRAQIELQRERDRLKLLLDLNNSVVSNLELRDLLRAISVSIRRVMQCEFVGVALPDSSDSDQLRLYAIDFPDSKGFIKEEHLIASDDSPFGTVFRTGEPLVLSDIKRQCGHALAVAEDFKSGCILPLVSRDRILGVLSLVRTQENAFTDADLTFLTQVANQVAIAVENACAYQQIAELKDKLAQEKLYLEDEILSELNFEEIIGQSVGLRHVLQQVETVAPSDSTVLLLGETGTGKELIARAIHHLSRRKDRTFVKLNCAAIPTGLLESELFGHERGAFTGAISQKIGRLELADQGTLFLDEVGDIPLELQPKLLRVLQEREFERLGSTKTLRVDVRLVAATNRDLQQMMANHEFRSDLYYRLNVFPIRIPPLRERAEDIPMLVRHFTQKFARRMEKRIDTIPAAAMKKLVQYPWPGNVRELENFIERAVILTRGSVLNLPISELNVAAPVARVAVAASDERDRIVRVLKESQGQVGGANGAAARLGLKRTTLISRLKKLGINPKDVL